jgi:major intracellular serine protease
MIRPEAKDVRVIPFTVETIEQKADTIPEGVNIIEAPSVWAEGYNGEDIVVAVLDTGVQKDHPDLKDSIIGGKNFTDDGENDDFHDFNGHGTHVAGTIAATNKNAQGVVGVAPGVKLLICKVLDSNGTGYFSWITEAIRYATSWTGANGEKVRVISMSLGGPEEVPELEKAINEAIEKDIAVVVAAGNEGDNFEDSFEYSYPGGYNSVIEVAASTLDNKLAPFSNNNEEVDVIAPGVDVLSTWPGNKYARISGTSMSTPHVAGALALLIQMGEKEFKRTLTEAEIYAMLVKRTVSLGYRKSSEGHGLIRLNYTERVRNLLSYIDQNF